MTVLHINIIKLFGVKNKPTNVCNDPVFQTADHLEELQFGSERSNCRFVRAKLSPPRWPFQDVLTLHDCRPQVFVELKNTRNRQTLNRKVI